MDLRLIKNPDHVIENAIGDDDADSDLIPTPSTESSANARRADEPAAALEKIALRFEAHISEQIRGLENRLLSTITRDISALGAEVSALRKAVTELRGHGNQRHAGDGARCPPPATAPSHQAPDAPAPSAHAAGRPAASRPSARGKAIASLYSTRVTGGGVGGAGGAAAALNSAQVASRGGLREMLGRSAIIGDIRDIPRGRRSPDATGGRSGDGLRSRSADAADDRPAGGAEGRLPNRWR